MEEKSGTVLVIDDSPAIARQLFEALGDNYHVLVATSGADGKPVVPGIFAAVPYCIDLIGGPYVETNAAVIKAFRPKSAVRAPYRG